MMKNIIYVVIIVFVSITGVNFITNQQHAVAEEQPVPSYAKWGRIAMKETMEKYPQAQIIDYLHVGKKTKGNNEVEQFKLWLKQDNKEFGVLIDIEFEPNTEKIVSVTFKETNE